MKGNISDGIDNPEKKRIKLGQKGSIKFASFLKQFHQNHTFCQSGKKFVTVLSLKKMVIPK